MRWIIGIGGGVIGLLLLLCYALLEVMRIADEEAREHFQQRSEGEGMTRLSEADFIGYPKWHEGEPINWEVEPSEIQITHFSFWDAAVDGNRIEEDNDG